VATIAAVDEGVEPFFAEHCYGCHNASKQKGGLNLKLLQGHESVVSSPNTWEAVLGKLRSGEMPPDDEPRPEPAALTEVERRIDVALADADARARPDPGHVTTRRLNRTEYNNSVRDLLGVDLQPADEFPQDDSGYGFDNIGDVLSVPPLLMERYMVAAERVARTAIFGPGEELHLEFEASQALGLPFLLTLRKVVLPQAIRVVIPPMTSNCVSMFKDTSLASTVALPELLKEATNAQSLYANPSPLIGAALVYLIFLWPMVRLVSLLEARFKDEKAR